MTFDPAGFLAEQGIIEAGDATVRPLAGGYWNQVVRVLSDGRDLVVKHFGDSSVAATLFPLLPEDEARALEVLAPFNIAPEPVGFFPAQGGHGPVLVYDFFAGDMWDGDVADAAALLATLHGVETDGFRTMPASPTAIMADADRLPQPPTDDAAWRRIIAARPRIVDDVQPSKRVMVHGDFSAGNMIAGPAGIRCIDWQCPGMGDAAEDLWSFLSPAFQILYDRAPFDEAAIVRCRAAYGDAAVLDRLDYLAPYFSYRFAHYCCFRTHQLAVVDAAGSDRYRRAADAETAWLERHQPDV
jgi:aminoglycoside phosphotransferase (APT) family kinase protein